MNPDARNGLVDLDDLAAGSVVEQLRLGVDGTTPQANAARAARARLVGLAQAAREGEGVSGRVPGPGIARLVERHGGDMTAVVDDPRFMDAVRIHLGLVEVDGPRGRVDPLLGQGRYTCTASQVVRARRVAGADAWTLRDFTTAAGLTVVDVEPITSRYPQVDAAGLPGGGLQVITRRAGAGRALRLVPVPESRGATLVGVLCGARGQATGPRVRIDRSEVAGQWLGMTTEQARRVITAARSVLDDGYAYALGRLDRAGVDRSSLDPGLRPSPTPGIGVAMDQDPPAVTVNRTLAAQRTSWTPTGSARLSEASPDPVVRRWDDPHRGPRRSGPAPR